MSSALWKSRESDKELVTNLMNQIQELRTSAGEKSETIDTLEQDINCKYNATMAVKEESKELIRRQEVDILELKETLRLKILSEDIKRLCEDLAHATEQLSMLTGASKKHSGLLQSAQEELNKEALIQELQHKVNQENEEVEQKSEYNLKMRQLEHVMALLTTIQSPKTPPYFQAHLANSWKHKNKR